ncbi:uncharacterized protein G2W53_001315 [Senna tora]|uniref:Uncharacterized protein n=1 Tax=Senna tora TaxID=362788 RepID=A0A835CLE2_9FABA|nr:uncharacterized protein G2W53_001315 [Senna tora]
MEGSSTPSTERLTDVGGRLSKGVTSSSSFDVIEEP